MNDNDIAANIRNHIELPAFDRVQSLIHSGQMRLADATRFRRAAEAYKTALFTRYDGFHPQVRDELLNALLADYSRELERLLAGFERRPAATIASGPTPTPANHGLTAAPADRRPTPTSATVRPPLVEPHTESGSSCGDHPMAPAGAHDPQTRAPRSTHRLWARVRRQLRSATCRRQDRGALARPDISP